MKAFEIPLDAAAIEYSEARKILDGHSLADAARFFMRHHGRGLEGKLVADAVEAFRAEKRAEGRALSFTSTICAIGWMILPRRSTSRFAN